MMAATKVPVIVLTGFLGSGKTTLLNQLLNAAGHQGLRPAILMNELGSIDVDGLFLKGEHGNVPLEKLIDGCICCDKKSEIPSALHALLKREPDVIFIELTGVANPDEIIDAATEPGLLTLLDLQWIVTMLDAEHVLAYNSIFQSDSELIHTLRRQMQSADLLVVNKIDRASERTLLKIKKMLNKYNPTAQVEFATQAKIDLGRLLENVAARKKQETVGKPLFPVVSAPSPLKEIEVRRSFSKLQTVSLRIPQTLQSSAQTAIEQLIHTHRKRIIRAKGFIQSERDGYATVMQFSGGRLVWQSSKQQCESFLVIIGFDLDCDAVVTDWNTLLK